MGQNHQNGQPCVKFLINDSYEEFFQQGEKEKELGLPYSAELVDRAKMKEIPRMQIGFYKFVVLPAFETLSGVFATSKVCQEMNDSVKENLSRWEELQTSGASYSF